jgi:hypothetical protein
MNTFDFVVGNDVQTFGRMACDLSTKLHEFHDVEFLFGHVHREQDPLEILRDGLTIFASRNDVIEARIHARLKNVTGKRATAFLIEPEPLEHVDSTVFRCKAIVLTDSREPVMHANGASNLRGSLTMKTETGSDTRKPFLALLEETRITRDLARFSTTRLAAIDAESGGDDGSTI